MRVHYGPHEFVPMHDHSAYPTLYVYLNDSGEVRIDHEPPNAFSVTRPPTHTGAFRIAPGMKERHSITNLSDPPSDFLRVELKSIPPDDIKQVTRGEVPSPLLPGTHIEFPDDALRSIASSARPPSPAKPRPSQARSLLVPITDLKIDRRSREALLQPRRGRLASRQRQKAPPAKPSSPGPPHLLLYPQ